MQGLPAAGREGCSKAVRHRSDGWGDQIKMRVAKIYYKHDKHNAVGRQVLKPVQAQAGQQAKGAHQTPGGMLDTGKKSNAAQGNERNA